MTFRSGVFVLLVAAAAVGVSACAAKPHWTKAGAKPEQIERDYSKCRRSAEGSAGYTVTTARDNEVATPFADDRREKAGKEARARIDTCMRAQGYFPTK